MAVRRKVFEGCFHTLSCADYFDGCGNARSADRQKSEYFSNVKAEVKVHGFGCPEVGYKAENCGTMLAL